MKIFYSCEYIEKQKRHLLINTISILFMYYMLYDNGMKYWYVFFVLYLISCSTQLFRISKYLNSLPVAEYAEFGIKIYYLYTPVEIQASDIKSIEYSQHKLLFVRQNGGKVGTVKKEKIPHAEFEHLVKFFQAKFPAEHVA